MPRVIAGSIMAISTRLNSFREFRLNMGGTLHQFLGRFHIFHDHRHIALKLHLVRQQTLNRKET